MDFGLFIIYIATISVISLVILIINIKWGDYFPKEWLTPLNISFISLISGLTCLLVAELIAPSNAYFYLNPYLYLLYFALIGCTYFGIYLLVFEMHFKYLHLIKVIGWIVFITILSLITISSVLFLMSNLTSYPWSAFFSFEIVFGLGIFAYVLLAIGSFKDSSSERLEREHRAGLVLVGIFSIGIAFGIYLIAWNIAFALPYAMFPANPAFMAFWLIWLSCVMIIFVFMIRTAVKLVT
ncbi:MAG: hypothetical protein ACTSRG_03605 [Candidatus Helarchaeota archaeon]